MHYLSTLPVISHLTNQENNKKKYVGRNAGRGRDGLSFSLTWTFTVLSQGVLSLLAD